MELPKVQILIADDHQMFIDGVKSLLRKETNLQFVKEVHNGKEALDFIEENPHIDLLITDISMPEMDGMELTREVKKRFPEIKVLVVSMYNEREIVAEIMLAEAEGYILKNTGRAELIKAVDYVLDGTTHYSKEILSSMMGKVVANLKEDDKRQQLTEREAEILNLIVQEYSTSEIAEQLYISPRTVDTHRKNIMTKTNSKTIVGLIKYAFRNNLVN